VTCLERYSKARPGRRARRFPRLSRLVPAVVAVAFIAGPALTSARPASADQLQSAQAQAAQIAAQIQAQGNQLDVLSENYDQDQIRVQQLDQQRAQTQAQVDQTEAQVSAARASLRQLAIQSYTSGSSSDDLEELFAPSGERSAAVQEYQQVASESVSGAIDHLNQAESVLSAQQSTLATTESQARATLAAAQVAKQSAASELASQQATLSKVKGNIATLVAQRQAAIAAAQAAAFQARVQAAQRAAAQQAAQAQRTVGSGASELVAVPAVPGGGGAEAVAAAESQIGVPYVWAGATPGVGFDCSGLTMWAWAHAGVSLAHSAAAQYDESVHISLSDLQPGDLLFYDEGGTIGHVTMYVGPGEMVQAMETGTNIQITGIWTSGLVGAGRP
jgi:peptidoglycan DL-endopeptidase CwlO